MLKNELVDEDAAQASTPAEMNDVVSVDPRREVEILDAPVIRPHKLDLARHVAITPQEKRYVVATFDNRHLGGDYITAVYPQQNGYLTLLRLMVCQFHSQTPEQALRKHVEVVRQIQQGKLQELVKIYRATQQQQQ
ncbi:MAG: hypothetical protein IMW89_21660 [Ktedonobacteraceae bacterium]|nr:hypothetical protein [Ktedonobacteraceae bacterium]